MIYELPFGKGKSFGGGVGRGVDEVIGGWQITGTDNLGGWSALDAGPSGGVCNLEQDTGVCRPNKGPGSFPVGAGSFDGATHTVTFFKPLVDASGASLLANGGALSRICGPRTQSYRESRLDSFRGPRYFGTDGAIAKNFQLYERVSIQFRMDAYNLFNHPILGFNQNQGGSGTCIDCSGNGLVKDIEADASPGSPMECVSSSLDCA